ncbi:MAG: hypothetical protein ACOCXR_00390 [Phototrophicaceae bacterium]
MLLGLLLVIRLDTASAEILQQDNGFDLPGDIAYVGGDGNVYTIDMMQGDLVQMTSDADAMRQYEWPTWATNGKLAFFCCNATTSPQLATEVYIAAPGAATADLAYRAQGTLFTYANWAPRDCDEGEGCRDLGVLVSVLGRNAFSVDIVRSPGGEREPSVTRISEGQPFYFSWSPDGTRLLTQRNTERIDIYSLEDDAFTQFDIRAGFFPAPAWSPVDDRLLVGVRRGERLRTDLVILAGDQREVLATNLSGEVAFNWSPDGNYVAYRTVDESGFSEIVVVDAVTGERVMDTDDDQVLAFFWSPNSRYIAYISAGVPRGAFNINFSGGLGDLLRIQEDGLRWSVVDLQSQTVRRYGTFLPTRSMLYLLSFFDQFAQSHSIWSPDSSHVVFSELTPGGRQVISILDMTRADTVPFSIAEGAIGIWSYR